MSWRRRRRGSYWTALRWRRRSRNTLRLVLLVASIVAFVLPLMTLPVFAASTVGTLPSVDGLSTSGLNQDMLIYDRNGTLLADIGDQGDHRIVVPLSYISPLLAEATIAAEDHTFYQNQGVDVGGIIRAALADYSHRGLVQGGSTISQQLVKQVFIGPNPAPTIQRKVREALLALELNRRYSKQDILEMYLNTIYYGSQTYGVEAAARSYFRSNAHDVTLAQASMLAGLPQAPTAYNPVLHLAVAKQRQHQVLEAMVAQRVVTRQQADAAFAEKLTVYPPYTRYQAPHFVDYVLRTLRTQLHIDPSQHLGYRIFTSLDLNLQQLAEQVVHDQVASKGSYYNFHDAALVSMDPRTGEILAMVGGYDYNAPGGQINMAASPRQPGSSFKIFTYTAAIESRQLSMTSPILDEPLVFPVWGGNDGYHPWIPQNYDLRYHGTLPLKMAMGNSLNIPAVKVEMRIGLPAVLSAARRMGVQSLTRPDSRRQRGDPGGHGDRGLDAGHDGRPSHAGAGALGRRRAGPATLHLRPAEERLPGGHAAGRVHHGRDHVRRPQPLHGVRLPRRPHAARSPCRRQDRDHAVLPRQLDGRLHAHPRDRGLGGQSGQRAAEPQLHRDRGRRSDLAQVHGPGTGLDAGPVVRDAGRCPPGRRQLLPTRYGEPAPGAGAALARLSLRPLQPLRPDLRAAAGGRRPLRPARPGGAGQAAVGLIPLSIRG